MPNGKHLYTAARLTLATVSVLLCCACLVSVYQSREGYGTGMAPLPPTNLASLLFSALACMGVAGVCIRSLFAQEGHALASGQSMPWLFLASGIAMVLCLASIMGNVALRELVG